MKEITLVNDLREILLDIVRGFILIIFPVHWPTTTLLGEDMAYLTLLHREQQVLVRHHDVHVFLIGCV